MYQSKQVKAARATRWGAAPAGQVRRLRLSAWIVISVLGAVHSWTSRHYLENADALSYLDMATYFARGDWAHAINGYWGPLYPLLLAAGLKILQPTPYWEFALTHFIGWLILLGALLCFEFLLRELLRARSSLQLLTSESRAAGPEVAAFSDLGLLALGYALFLWVSLDLIRVTLESPDLLLSACVYVLAGLLLRIRRGARGWLTFVVLGAVCAAGYWIKAPLFILSFVFLLAAWCAAKPVPHRWARVLVAGLVFLTLSSPWIMLISQRQGRLSIGESARLNYMWVINRVPSIHGQTHPAPRGSYRHPTRQIFAHPAAFEFATPVGGTYPPWYDPSYWYDGVAGRFAWRGHAVALGGSLAVLYWLFLRDVQGALLVGTLCLWLLRKPRAWLTDGRPYWPLLACAAAGVALFTPLHIEARYIASYLVLFWLAWWAALRLPAEALSRRLAQTVNGVLVALLLGVTVASSSSEISGLVRAVRLGETDEAHEQWQVAQTLRAMGLCAGDPIAVLGGAHRVFWARLGGTPVIAEIPAREATHFWSAEPATQEAVLSALAATGAKALIMAFPGEGWRKPGWQRIGTSSYWVYWLAPAPVSAK
jgi:hypothetical protein